MSVRSHWPKNQKRGKQPIRGRGGAMLFAANGIAPPEYPVRLKTRGEVAKEQLQSIETRSSSATTPDFIMVSNHIHAILFLHEKAGGASPSPTVILLHRLTPTKKQLFTSPSSEISYRRHISFRLRKTSLAAGEYHGLLPWAVAPLPPSEMIAPEANTYISLFARFYVRLHGGVANCFYICDSPFTVGLFSMPSPAGKGDRKAVDEENKLR